MASTRKVLVLDEFRELQDSEWKEFESKWNSKGVHFHRLRDASAGDASREDAFKKLSELDKKEGPFVTVVSAGAYLHKYKPINADFCKQLPHLGLVVGLGAGFDNIDTEALSSSSVYYCNTPVSVSVPTADSASVLILTSLKNTIQGDRSVRAGNWNRGVPAGLNPSEATLGIIGMGSIGRITCKQMQAFGMRVIYHNRHELPADQAAGATYVKDLKDLLAQSDVVSVHIPLSDATRHFISTDEFKQFKKGARLVNTARGPVVDEEALVQALKSGQISGAALDVFEQEPKVHPYLLQADNVLLQPHVGSNTVGTLAQTTREMLGNLASFLDAKDGQPPRNAVNKIDVKQLNLKLRLNGNA